MDYKDFTKRQDAFDKFVKNRKHVLDSIDDGKFLDTFSDLCSSAMAGDCVAQDCVAYFFNRGMPNLLPQNYDYYMSWEILAGANGNEFALEKLQFFLDAALNPIIDDEEILQSALKHGNITKDNAIMMISNLLCEGIVDELKIDPKNLIDMNTTSSAYNPALNRKYSDALTKAITSVVEYLMS